MNTYESKETNTLQNKTDKYLHINNCGYFENMTNINVNREKGRSDYQLIYIKDGKLSFYDNERIISLGGGYIYLYRPNQPQLYKTTTNTTFYWIHFMGTEMENLLSFFENNYYYIGSLKEMEHFCKRYYYGHKITQQICPLIYEGEFITLLGLLQDGLKENYNSTIYNLSKIEKAILYLDKNYTQRPTNKYLASLCNMSEYHFIKVFKSSVGVTPHNYTKNIIISKSKQLLSHTDYNISYIATELGFEDSLYFSRFFKQATGLSPTQYKKR